MRVFVLAAAAVIGLSAVQTSAAPAGGSDSDSALMVQPSTNNAKYQDKKKQPDDPKKAPDDSQPTAQAPDVTPQDQDKQTAQPMPGQEPSPNPSKPH
jgi:membrane protein involved in colicin uptake